MTYTRRTFPEVLDNLLADITAGVAAESHPFPPPGASAPPYQHSLQQPPASDIISLYGVRDGGRRLFRKGIDYVLLPKGQALQWKDAQKGAQLPDPGTLFYVNYYPVAAQRTLTDLQVGSVLRTLAESVALELSRVYAELDVVYQSGFIDTATGSALDNVVSLLGVQRVAGGRPAGEVEFTRATGTRGAINVPAGTRVMTADGKIQYETTADVTLAPAQDSLRVTARDLQPNDPLPAAALTVLPVPIAGIGAVSNPAPTATVQNSETDDQLRTRARNFLHGSERATPGALQQALAMEGVSAEIVEPDGGGTVQILLPADLSPEQDQRLRKALNQVRPAGVQLAFPSTGKVTQPVDLQIRLTTGQTLLPADRRAAQRAVHDRLADYLGKLPADQPGSVNRIVALVSGVPGVEDMQLLVAQIRSAGVTRDILNKPASGQLDLAGASTTLGNLAIADPSLPTLVDVVVTYTKDQPAPNQPDLEKALKNLLTAVNQSNANAPAPGVPPLAVSLAQVRDAVKPYQATAVFTGENQQSQIAANAGGVYALSPFEQLALNNLQVTKDLGNG